ncbi:MAG: KEOPS complex kinase/ATPase Bud32 [Candidatus Altiarchaeota archaeon]
MAEHMRKGAEADISVSRGTLTKERVAKKYRIPQLDSRLRRQRTRREAKNMQTAASIGIRVPKLLKVDERRFTIEMEYVPGELIRDVFERGERISELSHQGGQSLRMLHEGGLVHNDLTTSNLIAGEDGICVIDFGLGYHTCRLEDQAMDLVVFKKSIFATHTAHAGAIWEALLEGYNPGNEMMKRIETIEKRARYK